MKASIVDLRYHMNDVLKALERNEEVHILYRGKETGVLSPIHRRTGIHVHEHPFFNMQSEERPVDEVMEELRGGRYRAI